MVYLIFKYEFRNKLISKYKLSKVCIILQLSSKMMYLFLKQSKKMWNPIYD